MKPSLTSRGVERVMRIDCTLVDNKCPLFLKLLKGYPKTNEVLLNSEDANNLLSEATKYVMTRNSLSKDMAESITKEIHAILRNTIVMGEQTMASKSKKKEWKLVFWSRYHCRPDIVAAELNKLYRKLKKLEKTGRVKLVEFVNGTNSSDSFDQIASSLGPGNGAGMLHDKSTNAIASSLQNVLNFATPGSGLHTAVKNLHNPSKKSKKLSVEERVGALVEMLSKVEWQQDGKFMPKSMRVTRINLAELRNNQNWKDIKVVKSPSCNVISVRPVNMNITDAEKITSEVLHIRQELANLETAVMSVSQSVRTTHALLLDAELSLKKETAVLKQESSDMYVKLRGEIAQVRSKVLRNANEMARQTAHLESVIRTLQPKQKVFFSAQVAEASLFSGSALVFSLKGLLNEGWGIDIEKGTFTVPRDGCYAIVFNSLSGLKKGKTQAETTSAVSLMRNEEQIAATRAEEETPFTLSIVQQLNKGDRLSVVLHHGALRLSIGEYKTGKYEKPLGPISVFSAFSLD